MTKAGLERQGKESSRNLILEIIRHEKDMPADAGLGCMFSETGFPPFPEDYDFEEGLKTYMESRADQSPDHYAQHRCYFLTTNGYLGLGPRNMEEGDLICVLFGSRFPHVLREDNGQYILNGKAYIHGFMDGEAMAQVEAGTMTVQEFAIK